MTNHFQLSRTANWAFGLLVFTIGILNLVWVHPVPAIAYFLLSFIYLPPGSELLKNKFDFAFPGVVKIIFGIIILMFTLGASDLGDMIDKWLR